MLLKLMSAKLRDQAKPIKSSFIKQEEFTPINNFIVCMGLLCTKSVPTFIYLECSSVWLWFGLLNTFTIIMYIWSINFTEVSKEICEKVWKTLSY